MKLTYHAVRAALSAALFGIALFVFSETGSNAQTVYRNVSDAPFRSVSNGPQSAFILDVKDAANQDAVHKAFQQKIVPQIVARNAALRQELQAMRLRGLIKRGETLDVPDTVLLRQNGKIITPTTRKTRGPADELTFNIVTDTTQTGAFTAAEAADLQALINLLYPELRDDILGHPGWSGAVTVRSIDPTLGTINEPLGAVLIVGSGGVEIDFPSFREYGFRFLAMAQVMAQAFHARQRIAYDAWEIGMGRAAAVAAAQRLQLAGRLPAGQSVNPANGFYYTSNYDLLNQPALGNNTFTPSSRSNQPFNLSTLSGMLVPRLQMSSTAWLKCFIENNNFFKTFNTGSSDGLGTGGYYGAYATDSTIANDVSRLRAFAAFAVPNVEGDPFNLWFEKQYVLNTSVTPGNKLYVSTEATFPGSATNTAPGSSAGAAFFVVYYATTRDGNETDLSGTANIIYWDYTFANRLFLPSFDTLQVTNGFGTVAPFFTNIGSNDQQRVAVDFPINREVTRVYFPTGQTGLDTAPNRFSGVIVGADAGTLAATFDGGGSPVTSTVTAGEFGAGSGTSGIPNNFSRVTLTFTPTGGTASTFQRNVLIRDNNDANGFVAPLFQLVAPGPTASLAHTFAPGIQMISIPLRPLKSDLPSALGLPANQALLAQYREDLISSDKYLRYPSLPLYQPGNAMWASFNTNFTTGLVVGERTDVQKYISVPLQFGWNQIGTPYNQSLAVIGDLQFQYLGGDVVDYTTAVSKGYIAPGIFAYNQTTGNYEDITSTAVTDVPANTLEAWKGYWIRALVIEGVTLTYANPTNRSVTKSVKVTRAPLNMRPDGWRVPLFVQDAAGNRSLATFGQASRGADTFVSSLSAAAPPPLTRGASMLSVRFPHADWDAGHGDGTFLTDIRRSNSKSQWNVTVTVPADAQEYTLGWNDAALIPRGLRLTLTDMETGVRQVMNTTTRYTFRLTPGVTTRSFQIAAEPGGAGKLRISNLSAGLPLLPGGRAASKVTIAFDLSQGAEASVEIRSGGRVVRHLAASRAISAGMNQMLWDLRDDRGIALPGGTYTLEVTAHTTEGDVTRAITPLLLTR